jgi:L-ascorbate metabolism protein UlaG (beta-lactamase superfamily)
MNQRSRPSTVTLTWLGQAGFRIDAGGMRMLVDPWLSPHELRAIPIPPLSLAADGIDWLLVTHEHLDHLDLPFLPDLLAASPDVRVVLPEPVAPQLEGVVEPARVLTVLPGDVVDLDGLRMHVVPAYHGVTMDDAYGDGSAIDGRPRFVGYVLESSPRVYHAGDTVVLEELTAALAGLEVDIALLPINGRDEERESRGIIGNMDAAEAVELARAIGASTLVPYHWDGFVGNTVSPDGAVKAAGERLRVVVPTQCAPFTP